jgi:hypothetical protein
MWVLAAAVVLLLLVAGSTLSLVRPPASAEDSSAPTDQITPSGAPWYLGAATTQQATAQEIDAEFYVPQGMPRVADTYYPLIASAFDSNSSYDQIGISAWYGTWSVMTSSTVVNGTTTVYDSRVWEALPSGYYWFRMAILSGVVTYTVAAENGSVLLDENASTGGGYLLIEPSSLNKYTSASYPGYTVYEEVDNVTGGRPAFNLFCRGSYFVSNGTRFESSWTAYQSGSLPSGPSVSINGSSVIIRNVSPFVTLASDKPTYYTKEPILLSADAVGTVGEVTYSWYLDGLQSATTEGPEFNLTLGTASVHQVEVEVQDATETLASNVLELAVTKISLTISSELGTVTGAGLYDYGDLATVFVTPTAISTGTGTRVALTGWQSDSSDGYAGSNQSFVIALEHNLTEVATWTNQSLVSFRSDPAGLYQDLWYDNGPENITLPAVWSNDSYSRMSLTGFTVNGIYTPTGREGWVFSTDLGEPVTLTLNGVKQYSIILEGYDGPYSSSSQTGDLWFDSGSDAAVSLPLNFTQGLTRSVFLGWENGSADNTVTFPAIGSSHTLTPVFELQYFVYIEGTNPVSPVPVELTAGPSNGFVYLPSAPEGGKGAWFDSGSLVPTALVTWNETGISDSRLRLSYVEVFFAANVTESGVIYPVSYGLLYGVTGGSINASSIIMSFLPGMTVNGTEVTFQVPSDEMPQIEGGQMVVDRPLSLVYLYFPEFYFSLKTPFGGFEGWVAQFSGSPPNVTSGNFSYSAPALAGFLGTQKFAGWVGTVNSTSPTLTLSVTEPYVETAHYVTDIGAVASIVAAVAALVIGAYFMLGRRYASRTRGRT